MDLSTWEVIVLMSARYISGVLNAAAGGGSLLSFPALLAAGYPPIVANTTNNVAAFPGYVGDGWSYRHDLKG